MPTYEYACTSCGNEWEAEQSIKDEALKVCPKCENSTARRQISRGTGFILKGGGWYSDLYASPSNKKADAGSDKSAAAAATPASGDKSAATPSSSSDSKSSSSSGGSSASGTPTPAAT